MSDQPDIQNIVSDNNIITNEKTTFNPTKTQTNETIRQVAPKTAKKQGLVEEEQQLKTKKGTYYDKAGNKHEFEYFDEPPKGYKVNELATTAPKGFSWYSNGKSILNGRKQVLVKDTPFNEELKEIQKTKKYKNLSDNLQQAIDYVFEHSPIYNVTGKEFPNNGENLNERVYQYYKDNFDNKVSSSEIGEIKLDKRSIKDSIYHGTNENKMNAFVAVPYVIKKGRMIDVTKENNNGENRYLFIAPISLKGEKYFCEVVVKSNKDRQGFYLHEVELTKNLLMCSQPLNTAHQQALNLL